MKRTHGGLGVVRGSAGVTLIELLVSLTILGILFTGALGFLTTQNRAFREGMERMTGLQAGRFAMQFIEEDVSTAGTNVPGGQPTLVVAGEDVISFSADYATNVANDPFAVFYDPDAPTGQVMAPWSAISIPNTSFAFPDTTYGSPNSPAELVTFFFEPDASTERSDDYALYRQVNSAQEELVARGLLRLGSLPFFRYLTETSVGVDSVPDAQLPLVHAEPIHSSAADTGSVARIDSIRGVRISLRATNGLSGEHEQTADLSQIVRMRNLGHEVIQACGSQPILGTGLGLGLTTLPDGTQGIQLQWAPAVDETGGEGDVIRYVIWKRTSVFDPWGDPYLSFPAGQVNYSYVDTSVEPLVTYQYALAAQDCTPTMSAQTASLFLTVL